MVHLNISNVSLNRKENQTGLFCVYADVTDQNQKLIKVYSTLNHIFICRYLTKTQSRSDKIVEVLPVMLWIRRL